MHEVRIQSGIACKGAKASATVRRATAEKRAGDLLPVIKSIQAEGVTSLRQIATALNQRRIPATRGGKWSPVQVQRILAAPREQTTNAQSRF